MPQGAQDFIICLQGFLQGVYMTLSGGSSLDRGLFKGPVSGLVWSGDEMLADRELNKNKVSLLQ